MSNEPLDLEHFDLDTAWLIGTTLATNCREQQLPVTISIHLGMQRVFQAALPGTSADNDSWVERKSQVSAGSAARLRRFTPGTWATTPTSSSPLCLVTRAVRTLGWGRADPGTRQHDRSARRVRS
jgi:hypothetical protein